VSVEGWACPNCGATKGFSQNVEVTMDAYREVTLVREDLRWVWPDYRPGDAVVLPDGLRGFVEWFRDGLIAIRGWHERFKPHEVYSPVPITRSEPLIPDGS
jgi:hypothetical protein